MVRFLKSKTTTINYSFLLLELMAELEPYIYLQRDINGTYRVVWDKPESADACFDWTYVVVGISSKRTAHRIARELQSLVDIEVSKKD